MSRRRARSARNRWIALGVLTVAAVLVVTLRPDELPSVPGGTNLRPLEHHGQALRALFEAGSNRDVIIQYLLADVVGNVLLFVPVGITVAGALARSSAPRRLLAASAVGVFLSGAIEVVQLWIPGRATDVDDVIFNGLGAVVGAAALLVYLRRTRARGQARGRPAPRRPRPARGG